MTRSRLEVMKLKLVGKNEEDDGRERREQRKKREGGEMQVIETADEGEVKRARKGWSCTIVRFRYVFSPTSRLYAP